MPMITPDHVRFWLRRFRLLTIWAEWYGWHPEMYSLSLEIAGSRTWGIISIRGCLVIVSAGIVVDIKHPLPVVRL